jgi:hypothetical protein
LKVEVKVDICFWDLSGTDGASYVFWAEVSLGSGLEKWVDLPLSPAMLKQVEYKANDKES